LDPAPWPAQLRGPAIVETEDPRHHQVPGIFRCRASRGDRGGAGGNRTRVLERRTRSSPGAVNDGGFSAPALALTRRRRAQSGKSPGHSSWQEV